MLSSNGLLTLVAALPLTSALGCYSGGLAFEDLHGGVSSNDLDMDGEVLGDIERVCNLVNNAVFNKDDPPFTDCSNWNVTVEPDDSCYDSCLAAALGDCDPDCGGPVVGSTNRIDWKIQYNNAADSATMTYDICKSAFSTELGGCDTGSEQNHDDFFWVIDPNAGGCPAPSPTEPTPEAAKPSPYPSTPTTNEFSYRDYDENSDTDKADRTKVHDAFSSWAEVIEGAIDSLGDTNDKTFDRWFPDKAGDNDAREYVKGVFATIFDVDNVTPIPRTNVAKFINEQKDYSDTASCDGTINAYFSRFQGQFHICSSGLAQPTTPNDNQCKDFGETVSAKMQSLTGTLIHEFMHSAEVDKAPNSLGHVTDVSGAVGPSGSMDLRKGSDSQQTFLNADNYK